VNFLSPLVHVVNLDSDNVLNVTETNGFVRIIPDPKFGDILKVTINENELKENCTYGCTTTILANQTLQIEAWNLWGGHASSHLEKFQATLQKKINWPIIYVAMFAIAIGFMAWKFGSQILEYVGFKSA
jgi:hypothetical protein